MGKYDDVDSMLVQRGQGLFPFVEIDQPRDWAIIDDMLSLMPSCGERLMTVEEVLGFYD